MSEYIYRINRTSASIWSDRKAIISKIDFELTERCNNNCVHCCINLSENDLYAKKREIPAEEVKRILKEVADLGALTVRFTGGEPLLREDFKELYLFARRLGLRVMLFTNARLITPEIVALFKQFPPRELIEVTVYGMHEESYEKATRVKGSFKEFWRGVNLLLENKIPFIVKAALLPSNKHEVDEFETWAKTIPWLDHAPTYSMFFDLRCRREEDKNEVIKKIRISPLEGLQTLTRDKERYLKGMREFCSKFMRSSGNKLFSCGAGHGGGCVDSYGNLQLCLPLRHPDTVYKLRKGTVKDAVNNFFPKIKEMEANNPEYLKRCARCFLKGLCEQCPAKSWTENGTLDTPVEYLCEVAHAQARYLGLVEDSEKAWKVEDWEKRIERFSKDRVS